MKRVQSFHRKRPHMLPPLPDLPTAFAAMAPLQPPDLVLMGNRLGSPAPNRNGPTQHDYSYGGGNGQPLIKVTGPGSDENEKLNMKLDLLPESITKTENDLLHMFQKRNSPNLYELESRLCERENKKNLSRKFDYLRDDLNKKLKVHSVLPLEESENLKTAPEHKILSIPNRYTPLKPIRPDRIENECDEFNELERKSILT